MKKTTKNSALLASLCLLASSLASTMAWAQPPCVAEPTASQQVKPVAGDEATAALAVPQVLSGTLPGADTQFGAARKAPRKANVASDLQVSGSLIYSRAWTGTAAENYGIYSFTPATGAVTAVRRDSALYAIGGGFRAGNYYYFVNYVTQYNMLWPTFFGYDMSNNWKQVIKAQAYLSGIVAYDATYDYTTGTIWGCYLSDDRQSYQLGWESNQAATTKHVVCELTKPYYALACNYDGRLYGINEAGDLCLIDKSTGAATVVGNTGIDVAPYVQSADFDRRSGKLYWAAITKAGISALYEVDPATAQTALVKQFSNLEEFTGLYVSSPEAYDEAPAAVTGLSLSYSNASLSGTVTFAMPSTSFGGTALSGDLSYHIVVEGDTVASATAAAGATVSVPVTVKKSGRNNFVVTASNAAGSSPQRIAAQWIGADRPNKVASVTAAFGTDSVVTVSWTASSGCESNHYFVQDSVKYNVRRLPDGAVIALGTAETTVTDATLNSSIPGVYSYSVEPQCFTTVGDTACSNELLMGGVYSVPFLDNFSTTGNEGYMQLTRVDANADGIGWPAKIQSRGKYALLTCTYTGTRPGGTKGTIPVSTDEWMLSPQLKLEKGTVYSFTFLAGEGGGDHPLHYDVAYGSGTDYSTYTVVATDSTKNHGDGDTFETTSKYPPRIYKFSVPETGVYQVGFHIYRTVPELTTENMSDVITPYSKTIKFRGMNVEVVAKSTAPDSLLQFTATAGAQGARQATLRITAPTLTAGHSRLTELTGISVYRNDTLLTTLTSVEPGHDYEVIDSTVALNKVATYKALAYNGDGEGPASTTTVYVGEDLPTAVHNLRLRDTGSSFKLSWDLPTGQNGGYINPANMHYYVMQRSAKGNAYIVKDSLTSMSFEIDSVVVGEQRSVVFAVGCYNELGGDLSAVTMTVAGDPYTLPFKETFTEGLTNQYSLSTNGTSPWWAWIHNIEQFNNTNSVSVTNDKNDYDGSTGQAVISYAPKGSQSSFNSPRVSLAGASHAKLSFYYWANPGIDVPIKVVINDADQKLDTVLVIDQGQQPVAAACWRRATVDLTPYVDSKWIMVYFWFDVKKYVSNLTRLDDIEINANAAHDLRADITGADGADSGTEAKIGVKVTNMGDNPAQGFAVKLFADDALVGTQEISAALPADSIITATFAVGIDSTAEQEITLKGQVVYADDELPDNNTCTQLLPVEQQKLDRVTDLAGSFDSSNNVQLTWTAPSGVRKVVKESFESYTPFGAAFCQGGWWSYDRVTGYDSNPTVYVFSDKDPLYSEHSSGSGAFRVWNPTAVGLADSVPSNANYSIDGKQFLICSNNGDDYASDTWLISPELDGAKQTISFWAQTAQYMSDTTNNEVIEIRYTSQDPHCDTVPGSLADTLNVEAFSLARRVMIPTTWTKQYLTVPEGTRHFAVRVISDGWFFKLDNVLYRNGIIEPTAYNVYRNGVLIGTVTTTGYTDPNPEDGGTYTVTAIYGNEESGKSNEVELTQTGLNTITATEEQPADIYNLAGQLVRQHATTADGLAPGFYIMRGKKIVVK